MLITLLNYTFITLLNTARFFAADTWGPIYYEGGSTKGPVIYKWVGQADGRLLLEMDSATPLAL